MAVLLGVIEQPLLPQRLEDRRRYVAGEAPLQEAEALDVIAEVVKRGNGRQVELFAQGEVLLAAARRDVDDAGALLLAHLRPLDHAVGDAILRRQLVERPAIGTADQIAARQLRLHDVVALERG